MQQAGAEESYKSKITMKSLTSLSESPNAKDLSPAQTMQQLGQPQLKKLVKDSIRGINFNKRIYRP